MQILRGHLILWVVVRHNVNDLADIEIELVVVFGLVLVAGLHLVEHSARQIVSRCACN